jgi:hypothetical protein
MITSLRPARSALGYTALAIALMTTAASAQELCSNYTVKPGDTLSGIAKAADVSGGYQMLYAANSETINNPNIIEVGMELVIPCADGLLPSQQADATTEAVTAPAAEAVVEPAVPEVEAPTAPAETVEVVTTAPAETATTAPAETAAVATTAPAETAAAAPTALPKARFLTGSNFEPQTDESLPGGGLFTEMVEEAMKRGGPGQEYSVTFVNDWGAHLTDLLPSGAFDMGFPWALPDCSKVDLLSEATQLRCTDFDASDAFLEAFVGYYVLAGSDLANLTSHDQLAGKRLCRPDGWFTFDLEGLGLVEPTITMVVPQDQLECWQAMKRGEVDVVTYDVDVADVDIVKVDMLDNVKEIEPLRTVVTSHVFVPKSNPNGQAYLAMINEGLQSMRDDGTWFKILSTRMREHNERNAAEN